MQRNRDISVNPDGYESMPDHYTALAKHGEKSDEMLAQISPTKSWDNIKWLQGSLIGQGPFGSVFLALLSDTGDLMAIKRIKMAPENDAEVDKRKESIVALKREIDLLCDLQHPHLVQYLGSTFDEQYLTIFMEYIPGGSVANMLQSYGHFQEPIIRSFVRQILDGLSYLHGRDMIHGNLKGSNVLVDNKGSIKISDPGISRYLTTSALPHTQNDLEQDSTRQASVYWMAPEVISQTAYTAKADIWSLGCVVVEMFTGAHPFPDFSPLQATIQIVDWARPIVPEDASGEAKDFLGRTFDRDWEKRDGVEELGRHHWF